MRRRKRRKLPIPRDQRKQHVVRKGAKEGFEWSLYLQKWQLERRRLKPEVKQALDAGKKVKAGTAEELFESRDFSARKKKARK